MITPYNTTFAAPDSPAPSKDLTTLARVKAELDITDTSDDTELSALITEVSEAIADYCNREFHQQTVTDYFHLDTFSCVTAILLSHMPVLGIAAVVEGTSTLDTPEYAVNEKNGMIWRMQGTTRSTWAGGELTVTYSCGYDLPDDAPGGLARAAVMWIKGAWLGKGREASVKSEAVPGIMSVDYSNISKDGVPLEVQSLLRTYKSPVFK